MLRLVAEQKTKQVQTLEQAQSQEIHAELLSSVLLSIKKNKNSIDFKKFPSWIQQELLDLAECIHKSYHQGETPCTEEDVQEDF